MLEKIKSLKDNTYQVSLKLNWFPKVHWQKSLEPEVLVYLGFIPPQELELSLKKVDLRLSMVRTKKVLRFNQNKEKLENLMEENIC